ncbi:UDP-2,4-diacetamido-2,4,6-trideoxy-beta-L-altropyranose hydrolase [Sphingomonas sp. LT1P40]|uniref:UDP-2,4-diacetamido-2,4, 6-trideoxy-beta-L-altropyranose hydrolase n=1 Tax=Alteristakelama amylovorans TaxID=3096166 RepID=UPI002FCB1E24
MKIAIRVDASRAIGTGHVRRMIALAEALRTCGAQVRFVTRDLGLDVAGMLAEAGFECALLPKPAGMPFESDVPHGQWAEVDQGSDAADTLIALAANTEWVVVDHYGFDARWHRAVGQGAGCRIAVIDDLADRSIDADVVIDHNFAPDHRAKYAGRIERRASILGGPRFALLGPAYADAPRHEPAAQVGSVGIFLGGVDQDNLSATALEAVDLAGFVGPVEIVSTTANPNLAALRVTAAKRPGTTVATDLPDLAAFFARHDIQIGAGGGATWERCCIGAPTLLLVVADNQLAVAPALRNAGVVATPDPIRALDPAAIAAALGPLLDDTQRRQSLSERSRALVDGRGARRVALRLLADTLKVVPATLDHAELTHCWRDHPATRGVSRNAEPIRWDDHLTWLTRTLDDSTRTLWIGIIGETPVGVIRFDRLNDRSAEVSLYLDPTLHGLGLGRALLLAGEAAAAAGIDVHAEVLEGNIGSAGLFDSTGYRRIDATHWIKPAAGRERTGMTDEDR